VAMVRPIRILLVEDDCISRFSLTNALVEAGFEVSDVARGVMAIAELRADPSRFGVLITDINLGRSVDGWEVAYRARELAPDILVVYMSVQSSGGWASKGVTNSVVLNKPFASAQLVNAILTLRIEASNRRALWQQLNR
jgi:two-component system cell cycle response regulator CpdR